MLPYALALVGMIGGSAVASVQPFEPALTYLVAAAFFGTAVLGVAALVVAHGGPDERGPDF